jgi:hypothetical protein
MGFLFILMFVMLVLMEANRLKATLSPPAPPEPACPPHKWRYHEIKDKDGATLKHTIACELCGPLKPIE